MTQHRETFISPSVNSIYIREIPSRGVCPWIMPVGCARYLYVAGLCQIYTAHVPLGMCHGHYVIEHISWVSHVGYVSGASIYWKYPPDKKYPGIYLGGIAVDIIPGNLLLDKSPGQLNSGRMTRAIMTWGCFPGKKTSDIFRGQYPG